MLYPWTGVAAFFSPEADDEAALLDAIEAGDVDAGGEPIPYPKYRSV